jgi:leader peptidase (prepilin peptidase)/N-methyltransferase
VIWCIFIFALGACIGSFLNVVIYRLPRNMSLSRPASHCPKCGKPIHFYDNIPIFSWLILAGKCRNCKTPISPRYIVIELLTGILFVSLFLLYFVFGFRAYFAIDTNTGINAFINGGWLILLLHLILVSCLVAASGIDLELWIIPISICWFLTLAAIVISTLGGYVISPEFISGYDLLPTASALTGSLAAGAALGMAIAMTLLYAGVVKPSYLSDEEYHPEKEPDNDDKYNHRFEICKEIVFLLPIIICSIGFYYIFAKPGPAHDWWLNIMQIPAVQGLLGSFWGYFIGAGTVWATRILGTLAFGREAMGLGDVHLMGAAGAAVGAVSIVIAFFIAPFFGLAWAIYQMFFKKTRQIPYGPFLSMAILTVMIFHDRIYNYVASMFIR